MASRFRELIVDCKDTRKSAEFWAAALDWETKQEDDYWYIEDPEGQTPLIVFLSVPEGKTVKNRLHIDLSPRDREQEEEVERLISLGARRIDIGQGDVSWVVMADPEGNEFCVLKTRRP